MRLVLLALLGALALVPGRAAQAAVLCKPADAIGTQACFIDQSLDAAALCNDGSQPAFSLRAGTGTGATTWVIWLQGGGNCDDQPSCAARATGASTKSLTTTHHYRASDGNAILSADPAVNPTLYNANTVYVHYCSSDDWTGGYSPVAPFSATDPATWSFQGRRIAIAAINSLQELNLGFANATTIVLGGSSAGGAGMTLDANDILPILPHAPAILLVNDAGFSLDIGQYDPSAPPPYISSAQPDSFISGIETAMALWGGRGDVYCAAAATTPQQQAACYNTAALLQSGGVALPGFVAEAQLDQQQVASALCPAGTEPCPLPVNPATKKGIYVTAFGTAMAQALVGEGTPAAYSFVSPDEYLHEILDDASVFQTSYQAASGSFTPASVWAAWFGAVSGPRITVLGNAPGVSAATAGLRKPGP